MPPSANAVPTSVAGLLERLVREPGRPRITWYGPQHERVELSGAVLTNWVSKTTNLLVEEFDTAPGTRVLLDLPGHWRALVWALGVWRTGAQVVPADTAGRAVDGAPTDLVVTSRPDAHTGAEVVAVALPALARRFEGALPAAAVDAAAAVMTYGDVVGWVPPTDPASAAAPGLTHEELLGATGAAPGARVLLRADDAPVTTDDLRRWLGVLAVDGSVVLVHEDAEVDVDRVASDERVTPDA